MNAIICGMSHAGLRIASLLRKSGADLTAAVEPGSPFTGRLERLGARVVAGDLRDPAFLRTLGIERARSVIFPSEDDLFNLNGALEVLEINPAARIVLRLFNLALGKKLEKAVGNFTVLSVSQLAASSFATAALINDPILAFEAGTEIMNLYGVDGRVYAEKTVAEIETAGSVKILAINDELHPPKGRRIGPGDRLTVFSRYRDAAKACVSAEREKAGPECRAGGSGARNGIGVRRLDPVLLKTVAALGTVASMSIFYFHAVEHLSFLDAGYFVVTILTTTGFGDINLRESGMLSKAVGMCLMLSGMGLMAMLFAIISDILLKKRFDVLLGRRHTKLRGHVVLCGMGDVGLRVLEDLVRIGEKVVVVESNADGKFIPSVRKRNIPLIVSDATQEEALLNANIREAKAIICATENDIRNLEIGLNARGLQPGIRVVLRIFEKEFAEKIQRYFGIDIALSSSAIAAPAFACAALQNGTICSLEVNGRACELRELAVNGKAEIAAVIGGAGNKALLFERENGNAVFRDIESCDEKGNLIYLAS